MKSCGWLMTIIKNEQPFEPKEKNFGGKGSGAT
jgi:hypothetical protein